MLNLDDEQRQQAAEAAGEHRDVPVPAAIVEDLPSVAGLVQTSFDDTLLPYLVGAQAGIIDWWRRSWTTALVPARPVSRRSATTAGVGFAELKRWSDATGFLSYVAVSRPPAVAESPSRWSPTPWPPARRGDDGASTCSGPTSRRTLYDRLGSKVLRHCHVVGAPLEPGPRATTYSCPTCTRSWPGTTPTASPTSSSTLPVVQRDSVCWATTCCSTSLQVFRRSRRTGRHAWLCRGSTQQFAVLAAAVELPGAAPGPVAAAEITPSCRLQKDVSATIPDRKRPARLRRPACSTGALREGIVDLLPTESTWRGESRTVLLPAFIGSSSNKGHQGLRPGRAARSDPRFYDLGADLSYDPASIEAACAEERVDVIIVIHCFGRVQPAWRNQAIADRHGCLLVEDLAHGWFAA